jgi:hypothetical protein
MAARYGLAAILRDARIGDARAPPIRAPQDEGLPPERGSPGREKSMLIALFLFRSPCYEVTPVSFVALDCFARARNDTERLAEKSQRHCEEPLRRSNPGFR